MKDKTCGCCDGLTKITPEPVANRPGLDALRYRIGTHSSFRETMLARLSDHALDIEQGSIRPLQGLTTRNSDDPAIALLDGWAVVADVLSFYQERIANEGFLRTATERFSIQELARLVGYKLRPGVASSVYLAFDLEKDKEADIPVGTRVQSIPGPGELPQTFETSEPLKGNAWLNRLKPRMREPQFIVFNTKANASVAEKETYDVHFIKFIYLEGVATHLKPGDPLLFDFGKDASGNQQCLLRYVGSIEIKHDMNCSRINLQAMPATENLGFEVLSSFLGSMTKKFSPQMNWGNLISINSVVLDKIGSLGNAKENVATQKDLYLKSNQARRLSPQDEIDFYEKLERPATRLKGIYSFRVKSAPYGHNAPPKPDYDDNGKFTGYTDWTLKELGYTADKHKSIVLDGEYSQIVSGNWIAIVLLDQTTPKTYKVKSVQAITRNNYGVSLRVTQIDLDLAENDYWLNLTNEDINKPDGISILQKITVFVLAAPQTQAYQVVEENRDLVEKITDASGDLWNVIKLDGIYPGIKPNHQVIVSGKNRSGLWLSELAAIAYADHVIDKIADPQPASAVAVESTATAAEDKLIDLPGDRYHTTIYLSGSLANDYQRETVTLYGNVTKATHGETRKEVLGSGDGTQRFQTFTLKQSPLTYLAAPTPEGASSTLEVRVNDIRWHEADNLFSLGATDRKFITKTDEKNNTTIIFGNGETGARLSSGVENIKSVYRHGIGKAGNVGTEKIRLLATKPLGVKSVINPLPASGGSDPEDFNQARGNVPLGIMALDRLVSVKDYADFARNYAGIAKASAARLSDGQQSTVHITVAGLDDIPISENSDLYQNLLQSLNKFGDPLQRVKVSNFKKKLLLVQARIRVLPDYLWEAVKPKIAAKMFDAFGFDKSELGKDIPSSKVISVMYSVPGVAHVNLEAFKLWDENAEPNGNGTSGSVAERISVAMDRLVEVKNIYKVANGMTLGAIVEACGTSIEKLKHLNSKKDEGYTWGTEADEATTIPNDAVLVTGFRHELKPAELAYLPVDIPETLVLNELTP